MASRGTVGKSQVWCRKHDTRTSRYESSMVMWAVGRGLREVTAAQVAGGSDRLTGGSCVGRVWCTARVEARGVGGGIMAGAAAGWCWEYGVVRKPAVYEWCVREDAFSASSAERSCTSSAPTRILPSRTSISRDERSFLVSWRAAVRLFFLTTRVS